MLLPLVRLGAAGRVRRLTRKSDGQVFIVSTRPAVDYNAQAHWVY